MKQPLSREFSCKVTDDTAVLTCYDVVGYYSDVTVANFKSALDSNNASKIAIRINSPGGDPFEATAIYNCVKSYGKPVAVSVDGLAASAASIIAMAGDTVTMGTGAMIMIHNAATMDYGHSVDLRKTADLLDNVSASIADIYVAKTGQSKAAIQALMDAETWMNCDQACKLCFANESLESNDSDIQNELTRSLITAMTFKNAPEQYSSEKPAHSLDFYKRKLSLVTRRQR